MPDKSCLTDKETMAQTGAQLKTKLDLESWAPVQSEEGDMLTQQTSEDDCQAQITSHLIAMTSERDRVRCRS